VGDHDLARVIADAAEGHVRVALENVDTVVEDHVHVGTADDDGVVVDGGHPGDRHLALCSSK